MFKNTDSNLTSEDHKLIEYTTLLVINHTLYVNNVIDDNTRTKIINKINQDYSALM